MPGKPLPSADYLRSRFSYDENSGLLFWKEWEGHSSWFNARYADTQAGSRGDPYSQVHLDRRMLQTHRIIWKIMTGDDPSNFIDHIDGDPHNNRWNNLRLVTHAENTWNTGMRRNNTSGYTGVHFIPKLGTWQALIRINDKNASLGYFSDPEAASQAYKAAVQRLRGHFLGPSIS
jgi:hypothetical protein